MKETNFDEVQHIKWYKIEELNSINDEEVKETVEAKGAELRNALKPAGLLRRE